MCRLRIDTEKDFGATTIAPDRHREAGFSMIEALAALFVFALAGVGLVQLQTQSLGAFSHVETRALASIVAQNKLVDAVSAERAPGIGASEGEVELANRRWRWRMVVSTTADSAMRRVNVDVWDPNSRAAHVQSHAFISGTNATR